MRVNAEKRYGVGKAGMAMHLSNVRSGSDGLRGHGAACHLVMDHSSEDQRHQLWRDGQAM